MSKNNKSRLNEFCQTHSNTGQPRYNTSSVTEGGISGFRCILAISDKVFTSDVFSNKKDAEQQVAGQAVEQLSATTDGEYLCTVQEPQVFPNLSESIQAPVPTPRRLLGEGAQAGGRPSAIHQPHPSLGQPSHQPHPSQGQPSHQPHPSLGQPSHQPHPSQGQPSHQPHPFQGQPSHQPQPSQEQLTHQPHPSLGQPSHQPHPSLGQPSHQPHPFQGQPSHQPHPSLGQPSHQPHPSLGQPSHQPHPSQGQPSHQPHPSQGQPSHQPHPSQGDPVQMLSKYCASQNWRQPKYIYTEQDNRITHVRVELDAMSVDEIALTADYTTLDPVRKVAAEHALSKLEALNPQSSVLGLSSTGQSSLYRPPEHGCASQKQLSSAEQDELEVLSSQFQQFCSLKGWSDVPVQVRRAAKDGVGSGYVATLQLPNRRLFSEVCLDERSAKCDVLREAVAMDTASSYIVDGPGLENSSSVSPPPHQSQPVASTSGSSYKNQLQEYFQQNHLPLPVYSHSITNGQFVATVTLVVSRDPERRRDMTIPHPQTNKKKAEQEAARLALEWLSQKDNLNN